MTLMKMLEHFIESQEKRKKRRTKVPLRTVIASKVIFGTGLSALGYGVLLRELGDITSWGHISDELFIEGIVYMLVGLGEIFGAFSINRQDDYGDALGWSLSGILTFMYLLIPSLYFFSSARLLGFALCLASFLTLIVKNPEREKEQSDPVQVLSNN